MMRSALVALSLLVVTPAQAGRCPKIMLLVDSSAAMARDGMGGLGKPSLSTMVNGELALAVPRFATLHFGLEFIQSNAGATACFTDTWIVTPPLVNNLNRQTIVDALGKAGPSGLDNAGDAVKRAAQDGKLDDALRDNVIVVLSTGRPDCQADDAQGAMYTVGEIAKAAAHNPPITTYVIGLDRGDPVAKANLDAMALAGGAARANCQGNKVPCYYPVTDLASLQAALTTIFNQLAQCDDSCFVNPCPAGQQCVPDYRVCGGFGECQSDVCAHFKCPDGEYCLNAGCVKPCPPCDPDTQVCRFGSCVPTPCPRKLREECAAFDLVCDPGDDPVSPGRCAADLCKSNSRKCPAPLVCSPLSGCCVDDPCRLLNCPAGTTCEDGYCMVDGAPPDMSVVRIVDASAMHTDSARDGGALPPVPAESGCACALGGHSAPSDVFLHLSGMVSALLPLLLLLRRRRRDHGRRGQLP